MHHLLVGAIGPERTHAGDRAGHGSVEQDVGQLVADVVGRGCTSPAALSGFAEGAVPRVAAARAAHGERSAAG